PQVAAPLLTSTATDPLVAKDRGRRCHFPQTLRRTGERRVTTGRAMFQAFEEYLNHYHELEAQLADPAIIGDRARYAHLAKEHGALAKQVKPYLEYKKLSAEAEQTAELLKVETDPGRRDYPEKELAEQNRQLEALKNRLEDFLLRGGEDYASLIMEIRAGTGGDEAALFAGDLYDMYTHYARDKGWKVEPISFSPGE